MSWLAPDSSDSARRQARLYENRGARTAKVKHDYIHRSREERIKVDQHGQKADVI